MVLRTAPRRGILFAFALTSALLLMFSATISTIATSLTTLSTDPFNDPSAEHQVEVEAGTFAFGSTMVAAFQESRFYNGGSEDIGFATTQNSGETWIHGSLPGITGYSTPPGPAAYTTNPAVTYDAAHQVWLIVTNTLNTYEAGVAIVVNRSVDGGVTWSNPVTVAAAGSGQSWDKEWIVCDNTASSPYFGHCYSLWDDDAVGGELIYLSTSTDGGLTWSPAVNTSDMALGLGGIPVVQPNGTVVVPYQNAGVVESAMYSFRSTDGGMTWGPSSTISSDIVTHGPNGGLRMYGLPTAGVDAGGTVYVVWQDCRFEGDCAANDLVLTTSTDGVNLSPVQMIPADPVGGGVDHFLPGLAVDSTTSGASAHLALSYYYYPDTTCTSTCKLDVGYVSSTSGGQSWAPKTQIAGPMSLSQLAPSVLGPMVGDYNSTSILNGVAYPAFAVGMPPTGHAAFNEPMTTVAGGLPFASNATPIPPTSTAVPPTSTPTSSPTALPFHVFLPRVYGKGATTSAVSSSVSSGRPPRRLPIR